MLRSPPVLIGRGRKDIERWEFQKEDTHPREGIKEEHMTD